jgi:hypothetical protein
MQRRDFFKSLIAAAAALSAGGGAAVARATTTPQVAITANTKPLKKALQKAKSELDRIRDLLEQCEITNVSTSISQPGFYRAIVSYRHSPSGERKPFDKEWRATLETASLVCVNVSCVQSLDVTHLGDPLGPIDIDKQECMVEAEYIVRMDA